DTGVSAEGTGGYARELTAEEKAKQQEVLDSRIAAADAVVTTASVPGRPAPKIISRAASARKRHAAGSAGLPHRGGRRGGHHGVGAGAARAEDHLARSDRAHAARLGRRRYRCR